MPKKPPAPPRLPPLDSIVTLQNVLSIENYAQVALRDCNTGAVFNQAQAMRILRTCVIKAFEYLLKYYSAHPQYRHTWLPLIKGQTIDASVAMLPLGVNPDPYTLELSRTIDDYLDARAEAQSKSSTTQAKTIDRKKLLESYLANFPGETIKILDICWAAGQHYREWKRWIKNQWKEGSTADLAFRRILTSGKRPLEFNKKPRPPKWQ